MWQSEVRHVERAEEVDLHHLGHCVEVRAFEVTAHGQARRRDQDVELAEALDGGIDGMTALLRIAHVGGYGEHLCAAGASLGSDFFQGGEVACGDADMAALARNPHSGGPADAR